MVIRYKLVNGEVEKEILSGRVKHPRGEDRPVRHFSEQLLKSYYNLECTGQFQSRYTKSLIKKVHDTALQRYDQTGVEA